MKTRMLKDFNKVLEWGGAILSIAYSLLIASNTGFEVLSFIFFLAAALLLFTLAVRKRMWGLDNHAGFLYRHWRLWDFCLEYLRGEYHRHKKAPVFTSAFFKFKICKAVINALRTGSYDALLHDHISYAQQRGCHVSGSRQP